MRRAELEEVPLLVEMVAEHGRTQARDWIDTMGGRLLPIPATPQFGMCQSHQARFRRMVKRTQRHISIVVKAASGRVSAGGLPRPWHTCPMRSSQSQECTGSLFAGLSNGELWHTYDHGASWEQLPVHLGKIHRTLVLVR